MESESKLYNEELIDQKKEKILKKQGVEGFGEEKKEEKEEGKEIEESPEKKHQREIFTALNRFIFNNTLEGERIRRRARQELEQMGDAGVDLLIEGVNSQQLGSYQAVKILSEWNTDKSIQAMESLLVSDIVMNGHDRSGRVEILESLSEKDKSSSITAIVYFANHTFSKLDKLIEAKPDLTSENESKPIVLLMYDIQKAIDGLQKFTDREGFRQAEELYIKFNEAEERCKTLEKELRSKSHEKLKSILDKPFEVDLKAFPQATDEEAREINQILENLQNCSYWDQFDNTDIAVFGNKALPLLYQAKKENRLTGHKAYRVLTSNYSAKQIIPILHGLLVDSAEVGRRFFERDILNILNAANDPESVKVIAEFVRRSAEEALKTELGEERLILQSNFKYGLRALGERRYDEEAKKYRNLLAFTYPELSAGYEVLKPSLLPSIERPKTKEQREWSHTKLYIRGSSLFAEMLGKGKNKVRDVDIFITNPDAYAAAETMKVGNFNNIDDLENILQKEELAKLKEWIEKHGYSGKLINLVRVPESNLRYEETFEGEPKLLLWDQALEGEIDVHRYLAEELQDYKDGNFIINAEFPERLVPNGSLTRALRLMDLSERFGLKYDETILNQAEQLARNSKIVISNIPANRLVERQELNGNPVIDPTFIKVFNDKKLRKSLLRKFPRLGQIAEDIVTAGSVENYIKQKFGEVYLATRGYVRLYDIDLSKSPVNLDRQKEFISQWYLELNQKNFEFYGVEKVSDETGLPRPEKLDQLIYTGKLEEARKSRENKNAFLDKIAGRYLLKVESRDSYEQRRKVELFLSVLNLEWPANMDMDKRKVSRTLIKLGVNPKNPILAQFDSAKKQEVELVISPIPEDILQASTGKPWNSCINLDDGQYYFSTYEEIAGASVVAYLVKGKDYIARKFIRAGVTLDSFQPAGAIEKLYGDNRYEEVMKTAIQKILENNGIKTGTPMMTYPFGSEGYFDSSTGNTMEGNYFYYTDRQY